jgi:pre-mRNA-splicing factor CWC26
VDDDIDLKNMRPLDEGELDLYQLSEDAPQIAGIIDERPEYLQTLEEFRGTRKWRIMSDENGIGDIKITAIGNEDKQAVTGLLRNHGKSDLSPERGHDSAREIKKTASKHPDSESSPVRKCQGDSDASTPRKSRINSDSDISPPRKLQTKRSLGELQCRRNREENDSDSSAARKHKNGPALSPKRSDLEVSPLRREKSKRDLSPIRRSKGDTSLSAVKKNNRDVDLSPVRKSKRGTDLSPAREGKSEVGKHASTLRNAKGLESPRKNKYHSDSSPPRKLRKAEEHDETKRKHDSDSDTSPPRKTQRQYGSPTVQSRKDSSRASSSLKTSRNNDSNHPGTSRKYEQHGSLAVKSKQGGFRESNKQNKEYSLVMESASSSKQHNRSESPVRKDRHHSLPDSPARKPRGRTHSEDSFSDNSPQRISKRPRNSSSPSRNGPKRNDSEGRRKVEGKNIHQDKGDKMKRKMEKTLDGKRAGLQAARELRQEISDFKGREDELFAQVSI